MKYRKKPVVIEAFNYDGDLMDKDGNYYVPQWAVEAYKNGTLFYGCGEDGDELFINTLEGVHHVSVGDYIIRGVAGELYPCKPDIFEQTYEEVGRVGMKILDACCGSRMFWFDKNNPLVTFMDNREVEDVLCDGRSLRVKPDVLGDFRNIPYDSGTFDIVVFDPPHLLKVGEKSWLAKKYGKLNQSTWREDLKQGFSECFRVLKPNGILVFKWNETDITVSEILKLTEQKPLIGHKSGKLNKIHWILFFKAGE